MSDRVTHPNMNALDHTSGVMRCRFRVLDGHVHCDVFGPFSGKAGTLIFRVEEHRGKC